MLDDKVGLIVLDDVWDVRYAGVFANALGPRCRLLVTTRDGGMAAGLGAAEQRLDLLGTEAALKLLADWAKQEVAGLPAAAEEVAQLCGNLPIASAMAGAMAGGDPGGWDLVLHRLRSADLAKVRQEFPNYPYPDLLRVIEVSVDSLADPALAGLYPNLRDRYLDLAVFREDTPIPKAVLEVFWAEAGLDSWDTQEVVNEFVKRSLARRDEAGRLVLHELQHSYVRKQAGDPGALNSRFLSAYACRCPGGWPDGPDDGYFFQHLAYHLSAAGRREELRRLLLDYRWLRAKLAATTPNALVADYDDLPDDPVLRTVQAALRVASPILAQHPDQLAPQLLGRLMRYDAPEIRPLLAAAAPGQAGPWLRPLSATTPTSAALLRYLPGHQGWVAAVAYLPDRDEQGRPRRAISASIDGSLKLWDLETGLELRTLSGHTAAVLDVAVTDDGCLAVSASADRTLRVWDLAAGKLLAPLTGHGRQVTCVAVAGLERGAMAVSGSDDRTLRVWELDGQRCLHELSGHSGSITGVAMTPDGGRAISASTDGTLRVWDPREGRLLHELRGHTGPITAVAVAADARVILSVSKDRTFRVWSLSSGAFLYNFRYLWEGVRALAMTPDGKLAVSASDYLVRVWDVEAGKQVRHLHGHNQVISDIDVTADGRFIVSASRDQRLGLWDLRISDPPAPPGKHRGPVKALAVTPDGRLGVSGASDGSVSLWDLASHTFAGPLRVGPAIRATVGGCARSRPCPRRDDRSSFRAATTVV